MKTIKLRKESVSIQVSRRLYQHCAIDVQVACNPSITAWTSPVKWSNVPVDDLSETRRRHDANAGWEILEGCSAGQSIDSLRSTCTMTLSLL